MSGFCPSCGFNLSRDELIERDGFTLDPRGAVSWLGTGIDLTAVECAALHTVAVANGRPVSLAAIGGRISDAVDPENIASVMFCRIRKRLRAASVPCPVISVHGRGYRWELLA